MAQHGKELSEDLKRHIVALHEDGQDYKKIANTLKLSCSTGAKIIRRFKRSGSTQNKPWVGCPKKLSTHAEHHIQMLSLKDWHRSTVSIAAEIEEVGGQPVSAQTIRRTLHQIGVHGCPPRRKPLLKTIHKKARKQFAEDMSTKHMDYWNHVLWSDEMKINLFGSDGFKHVWQRPGEEYKDKCVMPTVKHGGGNVMVWAAWVLQVLESYISLRETWTPTCTVKYCSRAWSPTSRNWVTGQCSSITMTPNTPPRRPLLYWRG